MFYLLGQILAWILIGIFMVGMFYGLTVIVIVSWLWEIIKDKLWRRRR
jgi:hypothetical protein